MLLKNVEFLKKRKKTMGRLPFSSSRIPGRSLFGVLTGLSGLQLGPGRAPGRARRREERTLVLIWQGIARIDAGVDVGSAKWPQNRALGPPQKKNHREKPKSARFSEIIKNQ